MTSVMSVIDVPWHGVTNAHVAALETVDQALLRGILNATTGTPNQFLYLETVDTGYRYEIILLI